MLLDALAEFGVDAQALLMGTFKGAFCGLHEVWHSLHRWESLLWRGKGVVNVSSLHAESLLWGGKGVVVYASYMNRSCCGGGTKSAKVVYAIYMCRACFGGEGNWKCMQLSCGAIW
jgi:hypothetical protein